MEDLTMDNVSRTPTPTPPITPTETVSPTIFNYPGRIIDVISYEGTALEGNDGSRQRLRIVDKRRRMRRRNAVSEFFHQGKSNIKRLFPDDSSPDKIKWKFISPIFHVKRKKLSEDVKKINVVHATHSAKESIVSPRMETRVQHSSFKETTRASTNVSINDIVSETSILLSYPIMSLINQYMIESSEDVNEENMDDLFQYWIKEFIGTCQRQIKNGVLSTNNMLAQYIDLNSMTLIPGHQNFIKVNAIPTWTQVRILQDNTNQKYIALRKSHSLSWFILPREAPKLSQQWVCYPIDSMNTFENELRLTEENSIQWLFLRMILLKCFNKIYKNDVVPIKFDVNNILLVSSTCGLIVVFKEGNQDLDIASLKILKSETLADVPKQWAISKSEVRDATVKFFYRLNIISVLISSLWPLDYLAYLLARLMIEIDN